MAEGTQPWPDAVAQAEADWRERSAASAETYARSAVPTLFGPWAVRLIDRLALRPGIRVLDLACGTGAVTRLAAHRVGAAGRVVGLDISLGMLTVARSGWDRAAPPVDWQLGTALALPYRANAFDVAVCAFGLMFFPDRTRALTELRRVLVPGGRLLVSVWGAEADNPVDALLLTVLRQFADAGASARQAVAHAVRTPAELQGLLDGAGFGTVAVDTCADEHRTLLAGTLNRVMTPRMDEATRAAVRRAVLTALASYIDGDMVRYPVTAYVASALA
jgi:SAM-dependent methyltransferase